MDRIERLNKLALRRIYNPRHTGRGARGKINRRELKVMIRPDTFNTVRKIVTVGPGGYGSAFVELSLRLMLAGLNEVDANEVVDELVPAIADRPHFALALRQIAGQVETSEPPRWYKELEE